MMFREGREELLCFILRQNKSQYVADEMKSKKVKMEKLRSEIIKIHQEQQELEVLVSKLEEKSKEIDESTKKIMVNYKAK